MRTRSWLKSCLFPGVFLLVLGNTLSVFAQPQFQPIPVVPGQNVVGGSGNVFKKTDQLTAKDPKDSVRRNCYHKAYTVKLTAGKKYVIDQISKTFDPYLRLEDANGKHLASDDDGGQGLNSRIFYTPPQIGNYKIIATTFGASQLGNFTLTVSSKKILFSKKGQLTNTDPYDVIRQNSRFRIVPVKMTKGKVYTIDVQGNFNPYLRLEDARGNNRAYTNNGGFGLNSALVFRAEETDTYRIIVTSLTGRVGSYTLTVSE